MERQQETAAGAAASTKPTDFDPSREAMYGDESGRFWAS